MSVRSVSTVLGPSHPLPKLKTESLFFVVLGAGVRVWDHKYYV